MAKHLRDHGHRRAILEHLGGPVMALHVRRLVPRQAELVALGGHQIGETADPEGNPAVAIEQ